MSRKSDRKGKVGEREFATLTGGHRTWEWPHDVFGHGRPWEVKRVKDGYTQAYLALEEYEEHATFGDEAPIVAARQDGKPWIVIQYYDDWLKEQ